MSGKTGERRLQILQALAEMLEQPQSARITTAALAAKLQLSEAALYRHFASKAQMFEGLFEFIETTIFSLANQIADAEPNGVEQAKKITVMLLSFAERNRGMTRVLCGDALVNEDLRLQTRANQITDRIDATFRQCLRQAVSTGALDASAQTAAIACLLTQLVIGGWLRFAQSSWQSAPSKHLNEQLTVILG